MGNAVTAPPGAPLEDWFANLQPRKQKKTQQQSSPIDYYALAACVRTIPVADIVHEVGIDDALVVTKITTSKLHKKFCWCVANHPSDVDTHLAKLYYGIHALQTGGTPEDIC